MNEMSTINFFTAVTFEERANPSFSQLLLEDVDSYFYLGGKRACVIAGHTKNGSEGVFLQSHTPSSVTTALKVMSYFTLVLPAIMLVAKVILRSTHHFHLVEKRASGGSSRSSVKAKDPSGGEKKVPKRGSCDRRTPPPPVPLAPGARSLSSYAPPPPL
jgi:hypothetical protein